MNRSGMTLLEVMVASALLTVALGVIFALATSVSEGAGVHEGKLTAYDEARRGVQVLVRELRQSAASTLSALPAGEITYQMAVDADGNGIAVDVGCDLELSGPRTISRDEEDANDDGLTVDQLVLVDGDTVRVLANSLIEDEDINENGVLDADEDVNENGKLDHGVWFEPWGDGLRVSVQTLRRTQRGHPLPADLNEFVIPRN